ncbi:hypothetical protein JG687_00013440 [Phytophthora cactorum]|uniref:SWIM-type domain-containing protein n=1 Tax=Phytophthora cactorum TaxID=29920 RepID=A0A329RSD6_9STRA|nr:hypothetical protein Pcac1_g17710 [Phytophthora cactorum]KAG2826969.1 hypothetical protein PC112_g9054 [Phytophthora cactorum]KAG2828953.1 hypothetical protein PC111_g7955 [Phytophthora cactorum]KAG2908007.1 hypothetical protein PC114_g10639 [Phytophthora cactorum]KAG2945162.1 hypothetical protein PC117_g8671 [Phytophthora cactorum]
MGELSTSRSTVEANHKNGGMEDVYVMTTSDGGRLQVSWSVTGDVSCDCLFFVSTRLPCKHRCSVLETLRRESAFEVAQLHPRWSMKAAQTVVSSVDSTVKHLHNVSRVTAEVTHTPKPSVLLASKN